MSALLSYRNSKGELSVSNLPLTGVELDGDILTVKVNASNIGNDFYKGTAQAKLALQIGSSSTDILSDFATLYSKQGAGLFFTKTDDIPVIKGAQVSIPFEYAPNGDSYTVSVSDKSRAEVRDNQGLFSGYVRVNISDSDPTTQSIVVTLTSGDEVIEQELTFAQGPQFDIPNIPQIDCIGGQFSINVNADWTGYNQSSYNLQIEGGTHSSGYNYYTWIQQAASGVSGTYSVEENTVIEQDKLDAKGKVVYKKDEEGNPTNEPERVRLHDGLQRQATAVFVVRIKDTGSNGDLSYRMTRPVIQKAAGTPYNPELYYQNAEILTLQTASSGYTPLNIVILGDGYKKKDLIKGGNFDSRARYAADVFFDAIDPDFHDRFNVYAIARESGNSGIDESVHDGKSFTYYETYKDGTSVNISSTGKTNLKNDVKLICPETSYDYYRTVAILLVNTDVDGGASDYQFGTTSTSNVGDGYATFGFSLVPANSIRTGGLIRHESVGHCLGRLGDEYYVSWYTVNLVNERHGYGFYRNIATDKSYWNNFTAAGYGASEVGYIQYTNNGSTVDNGLYRSTNDSGIMFNNNGTFNAVSRWAIYDRIRKQTEGPGNYWNDFLSWDQKNR